MPFQPGVPAPNLAARMGDETLRERGGVEYRELKARSLLNRCDAPRMPSQRPPGRRASICCSSAWPAAGVRRLFTNALFLRSPTREKFFTWLGAEFPRYLEAYQEAYATRVCLEGPYRQAVDAMVRRLKRKHVFDDRRDDHGWRRPEQIEMF